MKYWRLVFAQTALALVFQNCNSSSQKVDSSTQDKSCPLTLNDLIVLVDENPMDVHNFLKLHEFSRDETTNNDQFGKECESYNWINYFNYSEIGENQIASRAVFGYLYCSQNGNEVLSSIKYGSFERKCIFEFQSEMEQLGFAFQKGDSKTKIYKRNLKDRSVNTVEVTEDEDGFVLILKTNE